MKKKLFYILIINYSEMIYYLVYEGVEILWDVRKQEESNYSRYEKRFHDLKKIWCFNIFYQEISRKDLMTKSL